MIAWTDEETRSMHGPAEAPEVCDACETEIRKTLERLSPDLERQAANFPRAG